ncbi:hypothetical protein VTJ49DRAFT_304 [Mycothermus thermophilus]|uniref:Uncharacterized protein n=1 Tax=Humicola insolens TaxID=85995 RepID=A0ABR3VGC9_HUMIN
MSSVLEAKIVVLGAQGVGKTSLVMRYCKGTFVPSQIQSTVGASFLTKRIVDTDTDTLVRLQIWDTAGQERFRSISRLYYRGANACILCYSITDAKSFAEMGVWLTELRRNLPPDIVLHVVGTKADIVARDPSRREVPFERCIAYVAENLNPGMGSTPPPTAGFPSSASATASNDRINTTTTVASSSSEARTGGGGFFSNFTLPIPTPSTSTPTPAAAAGDDRHHHHHHHLHNQTPHQSGTHLPSGGRDLEPRSPSSKRSSGFWGQEAGWDACHEISAESGEGVDEVFRVVTRKLVEQNRRMQAAVLAATGSSAGGPDGPGIGTAAGGVGGYGVEGGDYYHGYGYGGGGGGGAFDGDPRASFRVGRDRRSWVFSSGFGPGGGGGGEADDGHAGGGPRQRTGRGPCC